MKGLGLPVEERAHLSGEAINAYLNMYADRFDITRRIRCNTKVTTIERMEESWWRITTQSGSRIDCDKLMIATGLTSQPFLPAIHGIDSFGAPVLHTKDFCEKSAEVTKTVRTVTVLGSNKSAWDVAYMFATAGVKVNLIIRSAFSLRPYSCTLTEVDLAYSGRPAMDRDGWRRYTLRRSRSGSKA